MIQIIAKKDDWDSFLLDFDEYDTYHTFDYHKIAKQEEDSIIFIKYTEGDITIGLPLVIREISNTIYKDATSVYGYCGPLSKGVSENFDNKNFIKELLDYFNSNNIISVFSRLNPYIANQKEILANLGALSMLGKVVNIDLTLDKIQQRQNYQRRLKNHVNKARRNCSIIETKKASDIYDFIKIYDENMIRVNAHESYYFEEDYFINLYKSKDFETEILFALDNETKKIIAGAMFFKVNNIVQYHLSGTKNEFLNLMPTKILIDEMRIRTTDAGYKFLNLGGGLGASDDDSLFWFKSSFSKDFHSFYLWKLIVNQNAYNTICDKMQIKNKNSSYFPLYRLKEY
ncbi:peptidoglycan bridge formation glycyltransferase FemA/FemB family protein [uncultured Algibacter sp.]|uniref:peptidoglycan bridge formation glycyltransferase FemA/FemB family protein n=1 Tax=uncultured Algibacter sp. TaxID=298659 RepID=UPI00262F813C|nr:peptidoglycan bridge formation glycyltransferase FemA/FemB family protein [uncultured Algibacter sp.]